MKFLVTGGAGFIGSYLVRRIASEGHALTCLDCSPLHSPFSNHVEAIQCDLGDPARVATAFRDAQPIDRVIHLAYVMGSESEADPILAMRVNALGTASIFHAACLARVPRVIFLSSESVYGPQAVHGSRPVAEDDSCPPTCHVLNYSLTKLLNEHLAGKYEMRYGTEIVSLRAPIVYGAGRTRGMTAWASDFASLPAQGLPVTLPFPADDVNCYIYVEDLVEQIYLLSLKPELAHRVYNTGGHTIRGAELVSLVREVLSDARLEFRADGPRSPFIHAMDDARICAEIGRTMRSMSEGVRDHIAKAQGASSAQASLTGRS